jgi:DNA polymerase zeta
MRLDAEYYINKTLIPPLERIFNLVGANVRSWSEEMPRTYYTSQNQSSDVAVDLTRSSRSTTLHNYLKTRVCAVCKSIETNDEICPECSENSAEAGYILASRTSVLEKKFDELVRICSDCAGVVWGDEVACDSRDCPVFWSRLKALRGMEGALDRDLAFLDRVCEELI